MFPIKIPHSALRLPTSALLLLLAGASFAGGILPDSPFTSDAKGTTGAAFLKQPVGARAMALGESYAAGAGDADALFWNPAGLASVRQPELGASYDSLMVTQYSSALSFAMPVAKGVAGASLLYHSQSALQGFDEVGNPTTSFTPYDVAASLGWAMAFDDQAAGVALKGIQQKLADRSAATWALDAGWRYRNAGVLADAPIDMGLYVRNLGSPIKLGSTADPLPLVVDLGFEWRARPTFSTFLDLHAPSDRGPYFSVGPEFRIPSSAGQIALRLGYSFARSSDLGTAAGISGGVGLDFKILRLDYAFVPMGDLGSTHRLSLAFRFGTPAPQGPPPRDSQLAFPR